jgi:hypothetical protein
MFGGVADRGVVPLMTAKATSRTEGRPRPFGSPDGTAQVQTQSWKPPLCKRLGKFGLTLEPTKTKLVEFGRFAQRHAAKHGRKRPETIYFLGFTLYCTRNLKGNFRIGMRTEKSRLRRSLMSLQDLLRRNRHWSVREQLNAPTPR